MQSILNSKLTTFKAATVTSQYIDGNITFIKAGNIGFVSFHVGRMIVKKSIPASAEILRFPSGYVPKYFAFLYFYNGAGVFRIVSGAGDKLSNHSEVINPGDWFMPVNFMYFVS